MFDPDRPFLRPELRPGDPPPVPESNAGGGRAAGFLAGLCGGDGAAAAVGTALLLIAAHPDDEVIGAGGQFPRWPGLRILHVTDGAPRNLHDAMAAGFATRAAYAAARRRELLAALALAGIAPEQRAALGLVDQEASLDLAVPARLVAAALWQRRPEIVITHPYEGGHPDHDATAFAVHAACRLLAGRGVPPPAIVEMTSYHDRDGGIATGGFLPQDGAPAAVTVVLDGAAQALKRRMLACFASQQAVLAPFPVAQERFRLAPRYDFTRPPHAGTLFYERFDWGMTGPRWRDRAGAALAALRLPASEPACERASKRAGER